MSDATNCNTQFAPAPLLHQYLKGLHQLQYAVYRGSSVQSILQLMQTFYVLRSKERQGPGERQRGGACTRSCRYQIIEE